MTIDNSNTCINPKAPLRSVLIVDPQTEGHHLTWIRYITTAFLNRNFKVTLMADLRKNADPLIREELANEIKDINLISAYDPKGRYWGGSCLNSTAKAQLENPSSHIFFNELDVFASNCLRKTAVGLFPPNITRGILSGVYFRPRFLFETGFSLSNAIKSAGFKKLHLNHWFNHIFLMDEQKINSVGETFPDINFHFLPDPWDGNFSIDPGRAKAELGIPEDRFIILQFGIGTRRKGLHHVIEAMQEIPDTSRVFLLCAGKLSIEERLKKQLAKLEHKNRAKVLDRYVSRKEESLCFCASDAVLLPYVKHLGSSGVLSRAAAAGKPVIASDFDLTGWRVRQHELGLTFQPENVSELCSAIEKMAEIEKSHFKHFQQNAARYSATCRLSDFQKTITAPFISGD